MRRIAPTIAVQAAGLLLHASLGHAHGHGEHDEMDMTTPSMALARPVVATSTAAAMSHSPQTYFQYDGSAGLMYAHIIFMVVAWVFVLPFGELCNFRPVGQSLTWVN